MKKFIFLMIGLIISSSMLHSEPEGTPVNIQYCKKSNPKNKISCLKSEFNTADRELNRVYKKLRKKLTKEEAMDMRDDSRNWIDRKEYICGWAKEMYEDRQEGEFQYLTCLIDMTVDRVKFLRTAFGKEGVTPGLSGNYSDGSGGDLTLNCSAIEKNQTFSCKADISVVRGPTSHIGDISVAFLLKNNKGLYEETECDGEECCRLDFDYREQKMFVQEHNCQMYHGMRAYFDGKYRKVK